MRSSGCSHGPVGASHLRPPTCRQRLPQSPKREAEHEPSHVGPFVIGVLIEDYAGELRTFTGPADKPVDVWLPKSVERKKTFDLVVHFHGVRWLPNQAVSRLGNATVSAV
jgi:hypothetical protein